MRYWRGPVLSAFDGKTWTPLAPRLGDFAPSNDAPIVTYTVSLEPNGHPWLFALDVPVSIPVPDEDKPSSPETPPMARLTREQQLLTRTSVSQPLRYIVRSQLRSDFPLGSPREVDYNRVLPPGNPQTIQFARELRDAHPDDIGYVRAVLRYFRNQPFVYTLSPPKYSGNLISTDRPEQSISGRPMISRMRAPSGTVMRMVTPRATRDRAAPSSSAKMPGSFSASRT